MAEFVEKSTFASDEEIKIRVQVKSKKDFDKLRVNIGIMDMQDTPLGTYFYHLILTNYQMLRMPISRSGINVGELFVFTLI